MEVFSLHCSFISRGEGNWLNILIIAVVIGIGVIKGIYNAQSEKKAKDVSGEEGGFTIETGTKKPSVKPRPVRRPISRPVQATKAVKKTAMKPDSGMLSASSVARKYVDSERIIQKTLDEVTKQEKQFGRPISRLGLKSHSIGEEDFISDSLLSIGSSDLIFGETSSGEGVHTNLPELSSRDSLRKAILYYEILGKPLSEREFGGHHIF
ncbi:MAG: hypothetical protein ACYTBV_13280 [Planctomycetota bacterium]|jgi:hypothetical protein